jgi:hypothetical protein
MLDRGVGDLRGCGEMVNGNKDLNVGLVTTKPSEDGKVAAIEARKDRVVSGPISLGTEYLSPEDPVYECCYDSSVYAFD